jgi:hypothetical protein
LLFLLPCRFNNPLRLIAELYGHLSVPLLHLFV